MSSEQQATLAELARSNRALRMLSDSNQSLIRTKSEAALLQEICRIAVEIGNYRMAWVGFAKDDAARTVQPLACAGCDEGYLESAAISWREGCGGPVATAIATGEPCIVRNIREDPVFASRREAALRSGYQAAIVLPLLVEARAFGVLEIYSTESDAFEAHEVDILKELAGDVAYGLSALRMRAERDRAAEALRESNRLLEAAQRLAHVGHWYRDLRTDAVTWSDETYRIFGRVPRQPLMTTLSHSALLEIIHPDDRARVFQAFQAAVAGGPPYNLDYRIVRPNGEVRLLHVEGEVERDEQGPLRLFGVILDITERTQAARQLYLLNYALDQVSDGIFLMRGESPAFEYVNQAGARSLGYSVSELTSGSGVFEIDPEMTAERWPQVLEAIKRDRRLTIETKHRTRDGRIIPVEVTGNYFEFESQFYNMAIVRDMTERKAARQLEEQLRQAQKMEAVGQLAGGIAHDFNNILAVIQMESSASLQDAGASAETRESLREILAASERASNLTRQLLTFSRRQVPRLVELDLSQIVGNVMKLLRRVLGEDIVVESRFAKGLPAVHGDPGMMEQVLMNLAINARDAMPGGGQLTVRLEPIRVPEGEARAGLYVRLSVSDTGCGIANEDLPRIFDPFFTTKEPGKGTGLGLATVFGIVQQHQGFIEVDSASGRATTFHVFLPALESGSSPRGFVPSSAAVRGGSETVLVVEDDPAVRAITRTALQRCGYRVLAAESAASALQVWAEHGEEIDLLLTDLIMPGGLSGRQLAQQLLAIEPSLKVIYASGYSPEIVDRAFQLEPGQLLLQKPYTVSVLAASVRRCLDGLPDTEAR